MFTPSVAPPLTLENTLKAIEKAENWEELARWLSGSTDNSIKDTVERFLRGEGHYQPSWRAVIFTLDGAGEAHLANHIRSYRESVQGVYVCVHVCTIH